MEYLYVFEDSKQLNLSKTAVMTLAISAVFLSTFEQVFCM